MCLFACDFVFVDVFMFVFACVCMRMCVVLNAFVQFVNGFVYACVVGLFMCVRL